MCVASSPECVLNRYVFARLQVDEEKCFSLVVDEEHRLDLEGLTAESVVAWFVAVNSLRKAKSS